MSANDPQRTSSGRQLLKFFGSDQFERFRLMETYVPITVASWRQVNAIPIAGYKFHVSVVTPALCPYHPNPIYEIANRFRRQVT